MDLNKLRDEIHANAVAKGFWDEQLSDQHCLMLVITELSEAVEADRAGKQPNIMQFENGISYPKSDFRKVYDYCIKGTVAEELADAAIRLLDLAGARNLNLNRFCLQHVVTKRKTFTENIYAIIEDLMNYNYSQEEQINYALNQILRLSEILKIDLPFHVDQKMKYNQNRERLHGEKY